MMKVQDVMTKTVASCRPDSNLAEVSGLMWDNNCGLLPIVVECGGLTGVITDRDICIALGTRDRRASEVKVCQVVHRPAVVCHADDDVCAALKIMAHEKVRRLPVIDREGALVGRLSLEDVTVHSRHHGDTDRPPVTYDDVMNTQHAIYHR